ncbi:major facilitator superfamily domain-containing protein [Cantharellus anzutake]|uniref:major facilitator superfamily domain-containing protein n=1 Tax=Cantharellus anzutake TaxID=1750568 RepID=UPI001903BAE8|nr:major facilitator superfamily domain-containing protein [Cantharellus anzutake]KAF8343944.1 major facilitator superfamily domain-containing protein [Cantharellus anzutake]
MILGIQIYSTALHRANGLVPRFRSFSPRLMTVSSKTLFLCISVALNAISAGGIFCFPLFAPSLASHLQLTQRQISTIALAGMMGQYPFASLWGIVIDTKGPWVCALAASGLFGVGYSLFASTIRYAGSSHTCSTPIFVLLVFCFFLCGLGTVASYFSCLFGASKGFPKRSGLATGIVTALFGLSPLLLSSIGNAVFADLDDVLDAPKYLYFLACFCGLANLSGTLGLQGISRGAASSPSSDSLNDDQPYEHTPLIRSSEGDLVHQREGLLSLLQDLEFWLLGIVMLVCMGMSEMVISNIGSIVASFDYPGEATQLSAGPQVRLISLANTASRLLTGSIADIASPTPAKRQSTGELIFHRTRVMSRAVFVWLSCSVLLTASCWMAAGTTSPQGLWVVSLGTGAAYGMLWTVVPSLVEFIWGSRNAARNFGTISYSPFLGTPIFTFLYASFSDRARKPGPDPICRGTQCWKPTFEICTGILCGVTVVAAALWRRWAHRV